MTEPGIDIKITANTSAANSALKQTENALGNVKNAVDSVASAADQFNKITDALKRMALMAKGAFDTLLGDSIRIANQVDKMHKQFGLATDSIQRLGYAAKQEHGSMEGLAQGLKFLNKNLGEAANGSKEMQAAFARIGVSAQELKTAKPEEVLLKLADVMADKTIPMSEKTAIAMQLMGRGAMELGPMLALGRAEIERLGRQAEQLGVVMTDAAISSAEAWDDAMTTISEGSQGIKNTILEIMAPAMKDFAAWVDENVPPLIEEIRNEMVQFADTVTATAEAIGDVLMPVFDSWIVTIREAVGYLADITGASELSMQGIDSFADVLLGAMEVLLKFSVTVRTVFKEAVAWVGHFGREVGITFGVMFGNIANSLPKIGELLKELGGMFIDGFRNIGDVILGAGKGIKAAFDQMMEGNFSSMGEAFMREFDKGLGDIDARFRERSGKIKDLWDGVDLFGGLEEQLEGERARLQKELDAIGQGSEEERRAIEGLISAIDAKIDARRREREATRAAARAEREAADATRDAASAAREAIGAIGAPPVPPGMTTLDWTSRTPNPPGGGSPFTGPLVYGALARARGGLDQPGVNVWGIGFSDVQKFKTKLDAMQFAEREALRRTFDEEARLINRNKRITQDERDAQLRDLRDKHNEDMKKLREKQQAERDGNKKTDKEKADAKKKADADAKKAGDQGKGAPAPVPGPSTPAVFGDMLQALKDILAAFKAGIKCVCFCGGGGGDGGGGTPGGGGGGGGERTITTPGGGGGGANGPGAIANAFKAASKAKDDFATNVAQKMPTVINTLGTVASAGAKAAGAIAGAAAAVGGGGAGGGGGMPRGAPIMTPLQGLEFMKGMMAAMDEAAKAKGKTKRRMTPQEEQRARKAAAAARRGSSGDGGGGGGGGAVPSVPDTSVGGGSVGVGSAGVVGIGGANRVNILTPDRVFIDAPRHGGGLVPSGEIDLSRYRGGLALTEQVEEISRMLSGGGTPSAGAGTGTGGRLPGGVGWANEVNQDVRINVNLDNVKIASGMDVKEVARDLGREIGNLSRNPMFLLSL